MSSVFPSEVHTALSQLLLALASADNATRSHAEEQLNTEWIGNRPDVLLMGLAEQLHGAPDVSVSLNLRGKDIAYSIYRQDRLPLFFSGEYLQNQKRLQMVVRKSCFRPCHRSREWSLEGNFWNL